MSKPILQCDGTAAAAAGLWRWSVLRAAFAAFGLTLPLAALAQNTDLSSVPLPTYTIGSTSDIKPNIFMVLDDSGSMDWDFLPDWAILGTVSGLAGTSAANYSSRPDWLGKNASFNGLSYNPAITYLPPVTFDSNGKNTTTYPSITSGWTAVLDDGYKVQSTTRNWRTGVTTTSTTNLVGQNNYFYTAVPGEYCDSPALTNCKTFSAPSGKFAYPAPLRWCTDATLATCIGLRDANHQYPRIPAPRFTTITFSNRSNATVTNITVDNQQIMSASTSNTDSNTLASQVANQVNACATSFPTGTKCTAVGFTAYYPGGNTVRIYAPTATGTTPTVSGMTSWSATPFAADKIPYSEYRSGSATSSAAVPGDNLRTVIVSSIDSYPYPGTNAKAATRTDCAGVTCTYQEEMTNYANWWTYYRTRMQMMKTATSRAFAALDSDADIAADKTRYRVGYMTINNNSGSAFVNVDDFNLAHKITWFSKLFQANPNNGTPLRAALSTAGQLYGGVLTGQTVNDVTVTEPVQFSCQRNYTILSTDGYWNGGAGSKLDGKTAVGNADGVLSRPYNDGASQKAQVSTSQLKTRTDTQKAYVRTLQTGQGHLQQSINRVQQYTSTNSGKSWSRNPTIVATCQNVLSGKNQTFCQYEGWDRGPNSPADVATCSPVAPQTSQGDGAVYNTAVRCQVRDPITWTTATAACTETPPDTNGVATKCRYNPNASFVGTPTCSPQLVAGDYSNLKVYDQCTQVAGAQTSNVVAPSTCTITSPNANGQYTNCFYDSWSSPTTVPSCSPIAQDSGPVFTVTLAKQCTVIPNGGTSDTLADVAAYYYNTDLRTTTPLTNADTTGTCTGAAQPPSSTAENLCTNNVIPYGRDTATWQHMTVHTLGLGAQGFMVFSPYQNNLAGQRVYIPDYWSQPSGDFYSVANGSTASPNSGICPWMSNGSTCTWPTPSPDSQANIDDLWHAAVNGHGTYFSATDPSSLGAALNGVLGQIVNTPKPGTAAAAASSNPNITSSDNFVFSSSYRSIDWYGELIMQKFNQDGTLGPQQWSAMQQLDCDTSPWQANFAYSAGAVFNQGGACYLVSTAYTSGGSFAGGTGVDGSNTTTLTATPTARTVYTVGSTGLVQFTWGNLSATQQAYFTAPNINYVSAGQGLSQFCSTGGACLSAAAQTSAAGSALVSFLAGDRSNEGTYYRTRTHVLGDIVDSEARYVKQPLQQYADAGYSSFATAQKDRVPTVYVGSNDGMLHAFDALTGQERWAFIPSAALPNLYKLADLNYANQHAYFVDGTPEVGDICPKAPSSACGSTDWKTIIVGGLNEGGKSFYALDITDPTAPKLLWEFTDANMGLTYSDPRITKLADGTWVVMVASGYNNGGSGDGLGHLFVLNAATGAKLMDIATTAGGPSAPSGLSKIAARAPSGATNNTVEEVYGGDLLGNVWRFDVNDKIGAAGADAQLLITLKDSGGNPQPITTKPVVAAANNQPLVIVGTGKYLGLSDLPTTQVESMYAIKDPLTSATLKSPRDSGSNFVQQTLSTGKCPQGTSTSICTDGQDVTTASSNPVDWGTKNGWYLDFINSGERSVTDASLALGTLVFTTIKPQSSTTGSVVGCTGTDTSINAQSFLYYLDYQSGGPVSGTNNVVGSQLCTCVATRPSVVKTEGGTVEGIIRMSGGGQSTGTDMGVTARQDLPINPGGGPLRRISWRELNGQ